MSSVNNSVQIARWNGGFESAITDARGETHRGCCVAEETTFWRTAEIQSVAAERETGIHFRNYTIPIA